MSGYLESFAEGSYAQAAAAAADAAAEAPHELVPPPIDLSPEFVKEQQARFLTLKNEGRPGADTIYDVYVEDERLQEPAATSYADFVSAARLATKSVVRFDALSQSIDQDGDLGTNFVLDATTREATKEALQTSGANKEAGSVEGAMRKMGVARRDLLQVSKKVKNAALRARSAEETAKADAGEEQVAAIEAKIERVEKIAALLDVGVSAATGSGATSLGDVKDAVLSMDNFQSAAEKGAAIGTDVDVTSVSGVAGIGARLYYADELSALQKQITAAKSAARSLSDAAARGDLEALLEELEVKTAAYQDAAQTAESALEDRRKQYAEAGKAVDADARSAGAEEGEVSESLLLGSAAEEAKLMVSMGRDTGLEAATAVDDAYTNARKRDDTSYQTEEDMSEINGRMRYLTRGRFESLADDPDVTALYQMQKAIKKWQEAADQADAHLDGVVGSFRGNITEHAGIDEGGY